MSEDVNARDVSCGALLGTPRRVQLSRKKGWRMPENTVKVSRPGKWGNPFRADGKPFEREAAVATFRAWMGMDTHKAEKLRAALLELRGKNLACWCAPDQPCHADVLLELANDSVPSRVGEKLWRGRA